MSGKLVGLSQRYFGYFIFYYTLIVNRTTTWSYSGQEFRESAEGHKKMILASWHEYYLMFLAYMHSGQGANISCLALDGPKGEGFSTIASQFGALIHYTSPSGDKVTNPDANTRPPRMTLEGVKRGGHGSKRRPGVSKRRKAERSSASGRRADRPRDILRVARPAA